LYTYLGDHEIAEIERSSFNLDQAIVVTNIANLHIIHENRAVETREVVDLPGW
jgi:hypothetical protein